MTHTPNLPGFRHVRATEARRPRILALTTTLPARPGDGTPEFVLALARAMSTEYDITVLAPRVRNARLNEVIDGVHIIRFPYFPGRWEGLADGAILPNLRSAPWRAIEAPLLVLAMLIHAMRQVRRVKPDLLHAHWIVPAGLSAAVVRMLTRVPYIMTVHGADVYGIQNPFYARVRDRIVRAAAAVLPVSSDLADRLQLATAGITHAVVPMGVDMRAFADVAPGDERPVNRFLFVGRLAEKKGVDVLVQACARVRDIHLTIVGDGPEDRRLQRLAAELGVQARVSFAGRRSQREVRELMRGASALVIPSRVSHGGDQEGTPVVLAEGVATRTPIIASAIGGLAERLENGRTGILVTPGSVDALSEALAYATEHPAAMARLAENAHSTLLAVLDMDTTAARYNDVIQRVTQEPRQGPDSA